MIIIGNFLIFVEENGTRETAIRWKGGKRQVLGSHLYVRARYGTP